MANLTLNEYKNACGSCIIYIVLIVIFFVIRISISSVFLYFYCYLRKSNTIINPDTETIIC